MWRVWIVIGLLVFGAHVVFAEETAAIANDAPGVVSKVEAVVNALSPGYDAMYNFRDGQWEDGWSASIWNFTSHDYLLASARVGYGANDDLIYSSLRLDLPGISHRFVPATVRGIATTGYLDLLWNAVGKYGTVGPFVGYSWADDAMAYGLTLGGRITF